MISVIWPELGVHLQICIYDQVAISARYLLTYASYLNGPITKKKALCDRICHR
jgi:hypothetical protein